MNRHQEGLCNKYICFTCRMCHCGNFDHNRIIVGPKLRVPPKRDIKAWKKLEKNTKAFGHNVPFKFFLEYKELYRDVKRNLPKSRKINHDIGYPKSNKIEEKRNAWGLIEEEEHYIQVERWIKRNNIT